MKPRKLKSHKHNEPPVAQMVMRMVEVRRELANDEAKSVPVVIASEFPVERYDEAGNEYQEVLLMNGVRYRANRQQLPIVDSHDRSTVRNVLGSVRNIRTEGTQLVGDATFARDTDSQIAYEKLLDGHLTDFSITATPTSARELRRGESEMLADREIVGPAVIITEWTPTDASLVAAGADETSTVRELLRSYQPRNKEIQKMLSEETRELLKGLGMPEEIENEGQAIGWAVGALRQRAEEEKEEPTERMEDEEEKEVEKAEKSKAIEKAEDEKEDDVEHAVAKTLRAEQARQKEIRALVTKAKLERAFADKLCDDGVSLDIARQKVLNKIMEDERPAGSGPTVVREGKNELHKAMRSGLIARALQASGARNTQLADEDKVKGYQDFSRMGMLRMVERSLQADGLDTMQLDPRTMVMVAFNHRPTIERLKHNNVIRDAFHTTGSFSNLLMDAANKTLLRGYDEALYTWSIWARQAPSVPDFKNINRIRFSESPDLLMVPENDDYPEGPMSDSKETYKVEKFGRLFTVTWETVVNDDLDAISRIPQMHGNAARRTQNKKVYEQLTSNPVMGDGKALFASDHASGSNVSGGAGAPTVTSLNVGFTRMALQRGLNSAAILNIQPRYLIVAQHYAATAMQLVGSIADPSVGGSAAGNSNTLNIYGPNGSRPLQVVADGVLDGHVNTNWYLAADPSQIDTVELSFLQGEENPVLEQEWDFDKDCYKYKVRQTFGVKAIDWRGLFRNSA